MFLCALKLQLSKNKRNTKIFVFSQFNRQKQQALLAQGIRTMTVKRCARVQARVGRKECILYLGKTWDFVFFRSSSYFYSLFISFFVLSFFPNSLISFSPSHLPFICYIKRKLHLSAMVNSVSILTCVYNLKTSSLHHHSYVPHLHMFAPIKNAA